MPELPPRSRKPLPLRQIHFPVKPEAENVEPEAFRLNWERNPLAQICFRLDQISFPLNPEARILARISFPLNREAKILNRISFQLTRKHFPLGKIPLQPKNQAKIANLGSFPLR